MDLVTKPSRSKTQEFMEKFAAKIVTEISSPNTTGMTISIVHKILLGEFKGVMIVSKAEANSPRYFYKQLL